MRSVGVLIDPPSWPAHGRQWSHLVSDTSLAELHDFARALGVPARGFEGDHYDLPEERYADAVAAGAEPVSGRELLGRLQASGLRVPKRRGEKVLASTVADGERVDLLRSQLDPLAPPRRVHLLAVGASTVLVVDGALPSAVPRPGADAATTARALLDDLLGRRAGEQPPPQQVGYLRGTPTGQRRAEWSEPVLRWHAARPEPGRWVPVQPMRAALPRGLGLLLAVQPG